jgi:hypothetical protein
MFFIYLEKPLSASTELEGRVSKYETNMKKFGYLSPTVKCSSFHVNDLMGLLPETDL